MRHVPLSRLLLHALLLCLVLPLVQCAGAGSETQEWLHVGKLVEGCCDYQESFPQELRRVSFKTSPRDGPITVKLKEVVGPLLLYWTDTYSPDRRQVVEGEVMGDVGYEDWFVLEVWITDCDFAGSHLVVEQTWDIERHETRVEVVSNCESDDVLPDLPLDSRVAFASDRDGDFEIYSMAPDGSELEQLTDHAADDLDPSWSPDRSRVAFLSDRDGQPADHYDLYTMDLTTPTREVTRQTWFAADYMKIRDPAWSPDLDPDPQQIAIAVEGPQSSGISVVDPDTQDLRDLTYASVIGGHLDRWPSWTDDRRLVAFGRGGGVYYVDRVLGIQHTPMSLPHFEAGVEQPAALVDDRRIVHRTLAGGLAITNWVRETEWQVSAGPDCAAPSWSPDTQWVAWVSSAGTEDRIMLTTALGNGEQEIPGQSGDCRDPDWK